MKIILISALALVGATLWGCSSTEDSYSAGRGAQREAWNRQHWDPVCGHAVDPKTAWVEVYDGQEYYFESKGCARRFHDHPTAYLPDYDVRTAEHPRHDRDDRP